MIYGTNLLTRCPVSVPVFCCLFISEKLFYEVSRNALKIYGIYFQAEIKNEPEGRPEGDATASRRPPGAAAPRPHLGGFFASSSRLFAYKLVFDLKILSSRSYFSEDVCRWYKPTVKIRDYVHAGTIDVG